MTTRIDKQREREAARQAIISNLMYRMRKAGGPDAVPWRELRKQAREELAAAGFPRSGSSGQWRVSSSLATVARGRLTDKIFEERRALREDQQGSPACAP